MQKAGNTKGSKCSIIQKKKNTRNLKQMLVHPKDPVPEMQRKEVAYSIRCGEYPLTYIEQTGRTLDHRLSEDRRALKNEDV